jgi:Type I phosphodiesterase / nucleotide pyrophosphatase
MMRTRSRLAVFLCLIFLLSALASVTPLGAPRRVQALAAHAQPTEAPRLAVLIVFDQMRGDYVSRWDSLFGAGGFRRLKSEGAWFTACHYPYANTVTGAGHATVATGCLPRKHGIIGNDWYDRRLAADVNCVSDEHYKQVPAAPAGILDLVGALNSARRGRAPTRLLVPTLGDALKEATGGKARVISLSMKDRSAILPGGRHADGCYWFQTSTGTCVTSTYYHDHLPLWVAEFNRSRPADRWFKKRWDRFRPELDYVRYSGPDDVPAEGTGSGQGRTFPHPMDGGLKQPGELYYLAVYDSPFANDLLLDLAKRAIEEDRLGQRDVPDLLCVSFSSNDAVGHTYGPDSQEVLDITLRADRLMEKLLSYLDAKVGRGRYVLAVTADHGVCPLPEVARAEGKDAGRISTDVIGKDLEAFLDMRFGPNGPGIHWIEGRQELWLYLNERLLRQRKVEHAVVERAAADWLKQQPGIQTAYTRAEFDREEPLADPVAEAVRLSSHPSRCGDIAVILKPYYLFQASSNRNDPLQRPTGTTHGTPHSYDTYVPLFVYGPGIQPGTQDSRVSPAAAPVILARALGIGAPPDADTSVPRAVFAESTGRVTSPKP